MRKEGCQVRVGSNPDFLLEGRTSAFAACRHWSGRADRWFDFAQRAALHAVAPHLQASEQQNLELQNRLAREARARLDAAVERAVPNYREIDQEPRWHNWLRSVDPLSGRVRQTLLDEAIASATPPGHSSSSNSSATPHTLRALGCSCTSTIAGVGMQVENRHGRIGS